MILTLDSYSKIMSWHPCVFMGVPIEGECPPMDCARRNSIIKSIETAIGLIETQLLRGGYSLFDGNISLSSYAPYFDLSGKLPVQYVERTYTGTVTMPDEMTGTLNCDDIATIEVEITELDPELCEEFVKAEIVFDSCTCNRLGVKLCSAPSLVGETLTLQTLAYNLIDLDNITYTTDDDLELLTEVQVKVTTSIKAVPVAYWPKPNCEPLTGACDEECMEYYTANGCLELTRANIYSVRRYEAPCGACCQPCKYSLDVVRLGSWKDHWDDAVVSLANTLVNEDVCGCSPLTNMRWEDDMGVGKKWESTYRHSFWNPFGIAAPGAQKAWKYIEASMSGTSVWTS